jgi:hypothetical protein
MFYFVWHKDWVPQPVANRHKHPARYGDWRLFISGIEAETGIPPDNVIDLAARGFNHPYDPEKTGATGEEILAVFAEISHPDYVQTGAEGKLLKSQGQYLRETLFPPTSEDL